MMWLPLVALFWAMLGFTGSSIALFAIRKRRMSTKDPQELASALLLHHLSNDQLLAYEKTQYIPVRGTSGASYLVQPNGMVWRGQLDRGCPHLHHGYCVHGALPTPALGDGKLLGYGYDMDIPRADTALACLLLITYDEASFLKIANRR